MIRTSVMTPREEDPTIPELLRRCKSGDSGAREELFARMADESEFGSALKAMARFALSGNRRARRLVDTMDVLQSAFRTGMAHIREFRGETEGELYGWIRAIVRTKVNRAPRPDQHPIPPGAEPGLPDTNLSEVVEEELTHKLRGAIRELPMDQRVVVELRLCGANAPEIGATLGLNPAAVRKRESRALQRLKRAMS